MCVLIAIEGADGAGKRTATANVRQLLLDQGYTATEISFPRYTETLGGSLIGDFLAGRFERAASPNAIAVLYALDRLESRSYIEDACAKNDYIIFDRYIASNVVYQAAKVPAKEAHAMMEWIVDLETNSFGLPKPCLSVYLDTPLETSRDLMLKKSQRSYTEKKFDEHEVDIDLQERVRAGYRYLSETSLIGRWSTVKTTDGTVLRSPQDIANEILKNIIALRS